MFWFLIELWSTEKSYAVLSKEISLFLSLATSFDMLPKQKIITTYVIL